MNRQSIFVAQARPLKFPKRARILCERMAAGETLEAICARKDMPTQQTVYRWLALSPEFRRRYALARRVLAERWVDQVIGIADGLNEGAREADLRRGRLRIEARKWAVAQLAPDATEATGAQPVPLRARIKGADEQG